MRAKTKWREIANLTLFIFIFIFMIGCEEETPRLKYGWEIDKINYDMTDYDRFKNNPNQSHYTYKCKVNGKNVFCIEDRYGNTQYIELKSKQPTPLVK